MHVFHYMLLIFDLTSSCLVLADKRRRSHPWIGELQVLVKIIQPVEEVSHVSAQNGKNSIISVLADESNEMDAHLIEELSFRNAENL